MNYITPMEHKYFNINYEFDRQKVHQRICEQVNAGKPDYVCVADGVIMDVANRNPEYLEVINSGMFCICDSSFVPLYIRLIYGEKKEQYTGSEIFLDLVASRRFRMAFMGSKQNVLDGLRQELSAHNPEVKNMLFYELPFRDVDDFDYPGIAAMLKADGADIIWVALGAPKQELFMHHLKPYLEHGVMIAVGAAFKFYSGASVNRAPEWMVRHHMEFIYRVYTEPSKQLKRCSSILRSLPRVLVAEWRSKKH